MIWGLSLLGLCSALVQINGAIYSGEDAVRKVTRDIKARLSADLANSVVGDVEGFFGNKNRYPEMNVAEHAARTMLGVPNGSCKRVVYIDPTGLVLDETSDSREFYGDEPCEEIEDVEATFAKVSTDSVLLNLPNGPYLDWLEGAIYDVTHRNMGGIEFSKEIFGIYWKWIKDFIMKIQTSRWSLN